MKLASMGHLFWTGARKKHKRSGREISPHNVRCCHLGHLNFNELCHFLAGDNCSTRLLLRTRESNSHCDGSRLTLDCCNYVHMDSRLVMQGKTWFPMSVGNWGVLTRLTNFVSGKVGEKKVPTTLARTLQTQVTSPWGQMDGQQLDCQESSLHFGMQL